MRREGGPPPHQGPRVPPLLRFLAAVERHELPNRRQMGRRHRGGRPLDLFASIARRKGPNRRIHRQRQTIALLFPSVPCHSLSSPFFLQHPEFANNIA